VRHRVIGLLHAADEKTSWFESNRSGYRGTSHRLMSRTLGLCLTGVKREPKVRRITYRYVNVGSAMAGLLQHRSKAVRVWVSCN
jgi:hypothetical protein